MSLQDIIRQYVFLHPVNSRGWHPCVHQGCDHGKKGPRAAFIFDGDVVGFHCFNCPTKARFDPNDDANLSEDFKKILRDFNIPDEAWQSVVFDSFVKNYDKSSRLKDKKTTKYTDPNEPLTIEMLPTFYRLSDAADGDKWAIIAKDYLEYERGIDWNSYDFYLSEKTNDKTYDKWHKRLIIPMYKNNNLIFYQGRRLVETLKKKYESPSTESNKVLGGFDNLFTHTPAPLIVVEGWFDAFVVDGAAVIGNTISKEQIAWLNKSKRPKIYVPDKTGLGYIAAKTALSQGWKISVPDTSNCKDVSDAVKRFGKLYAIKSIIDNACSGFEAELQLKFLE